jgi:3-(3-hydroxy-phenyl)propionate hydroxylase
LHLLECVRGGFQAIYVNGAGANGGHPPPIDGIPMIVVGEDVFDRDGLFTQRLDATPGSTYLVRPDQHLCARWRTFDAGALASARRRALAQ